MVIWLTIYNNFQFLIKIIVQSSCFYSLSMFTCPSLFMSVFNQAYVCLYFCMSVFLSYLYFYLSVDMQQETIHLLNCYFVSLHSRPYSVSGKPLGLIVIESHCNPRNFLVRTFMRTRNFLVLTFNVIIMGNTNLLWLLVAARSCQ